MNSVTSSYEPSVGEVPKKIPGIPNLTLNNGTTIPMLGFGFGTVHYKSDRDAALDKDVINAGCLALKAKFTHLDAAEVYGTEGEVAAAIKKSGVAREKLFITTKIDGVKVQDTAVAFAHSLKRLNLDYVDLYLIHAPFFAQGSAQALQEKWSDMEAILATGRAKAIGVSNFSQKDLEAILETASVVPACNQIEYHPYLQHGDLVEFHNKHGIATVAYSPLIPLFKAAPGPLDSMYTALAKKYGVTEAEVALRWVIDQGIVVLTTSSNEARLHNYIANTAGFKLTPKEVNDMKETGKQKNFRGFWKDKYDANDFS